MKKLFLSLLILTFLFSACTSNIKTAQLFPASNFDTLVNNKKVSIYTIKNANGMTAQVTNYGARLVDLWVSDKDGYFFVIDQCIKITCRK